ncbi:MAG: hypothetical protein J5483_04710 [Lachnospiraceae bacterium]|nr:hypothetical protein [Lachnospiraceae bacterium]
MTTWIRIKTEEQLRAALESNAQFRCLIIDHACKMDLQAIRQEIGADCKIYLQLPDVLRQKRKEQIQTLLQQAEGFDGLVIKNLDELGLILEAHADQRFEIIADAFLYAYNTDALQFYRDLIPNLRFMCSDELTDREAGVLAEHGEEFLYKVYGYQQVMITAQCFYKNYVGCDATEDLTDDRRHLLTLRDEAGNDFYAVSECGQCYSVIYNGVPTSMLDKDTSEYENLLYDFTIENAEQVRQVLEENTCGAYTRGHHRMGVD